jgi:anti-sigma factor RsiW
MKCEDAERELIGYLGGMGNRAERARVDEHLATCLACRAKAEEFRALSSTLDELPGIEPSFGFDARVRAAVAATEPNRGWFTWLPQPRLALSAAFLVALSVWVVRMEPQRIGPAVTPTNAAAQQQEDFNAIKDLGVLENYDVVTNMDALSELAPAHPADQQGTQDQPAPAGANDNGGA